MIMPIDGPAAWTGADLASRTDWIHVLTRAEIADIERVVASMCGLETPREKLTREDVAFDALAPAIAFRTPA